MQRGYKLIREDLGKIQFAVARPGHANAGVFVVALYIAAMAFAFQPQVHHLLCGKRTAGDIFTHGMDRLNAGGYISCARGQSIVAKCHAFGSHIRAMPSCFRSNDGIE